MRHKTPLRERFWRHVDKQNGNGCHLWVGAMTPGGYGRINDEDGRPVIATRAAVFLADGQWPPRNRVVRHKCHIPACVRRDHLELGTTSENVDDKINAGRQPSGETHPHAKLKRRDVAAIRAALRQGASQRELAERYSVSASNISAIANGRSWSGTHRGPRKPMPLRFPSKPSRRAIDVYEEKVVRRRGNGCWGWNGGKSHGYGAFVADGGKPYRAHRFSYERANGPLPPGTLVRHLCHNPTCSNPRHLAGGTDRDNTRDAIRAGRKPRGERVANATLTDKMVIKARALYRTGQWTETRIAERMGVTRHVIGRAIRGETWAHLPGKCATRYESKLDESAVHEIVRRLQAGERPSVIAKLYKVTIGSICLIAARKTWKKIERPVIHISHHALKLSDADVERIRVELASGRSGIEVARRFGVSRSTISAIKTGQARRPSS